MISKAPAIQEPTNLQSARSVHGHYGLQFMSQMDDSFPRFYSTERDRPLGERGEQKEMPQFTPVGFGLALVLVIVRAVVAVAFIWLLLKLGRLVDAYIDKLKSKT